MRIHSATAPGQTLRETLPTGAPAAANGPQTPERYGSAMEVDNVGAMSVKVVCDLEELRTYLTDWAELATAALDPNAFYEAWMLMPALQHLAAGGALLAVLVFASDPLRPGIPLLCGLFPLESRHRYKGLPLRTLRLWRHQHCFLTTPLIRAGFARETWSEFFAWLASDARSGPLMEFNLISGEGPVHQALVDHLHASGRPYRSVECFTRAFFRPAADAEGYLSASLSGRHRKKIRHQEKQLSALGRMEYDELERDDDVDAWIEAFLQLEASGWKGREGSALAAAAAERDYFRAITREAFRRGQLRMLALRLDGRPIALKCDFLAGRGSFTFKIAFDENYARFSPGLLLEMHNVRRLHAQPQIEWVDSCTHPSNVMFNRVWRERRTMQALVVSTGRFPGDLVVALLPMLSWLRHKLLPAARASARPDPHHAADANAMDRRPSADAAQ